MSAEQRGPSVCNVSFNREGKDEMTKASIDLQDLRRRLYVKAKAETSWRFWGLYVHVCKMETLRHAYALAKNNDGAPGVDGVTFVAIEAQGVEAFARYGLTLHPDKTRFVDFRNTRADGTTHPETDGTAFTFLGFAHIWGKSRAGKNVVRQVTAKNRYARALAVREPHRARQDSVVVVLAR